MSDIPIKSTAVAVQAEVIDSVDFDKNRLVKYDYTPQEYNFLRKVLGWTSLSNEDTKSLLAELSLKGIDPRYGGITAYRNSKGKIVKIITIDEYRRIAHASGELAGCEMGEPYNNDLINAGIEKAISNKNLSKDLAAFVKAADENGFPYGLAVKATVKKVLKGTDVVESFTYIAFARDFFDPTSAKWAKGDWIQMLAKDAESHALRKAFSQILGGSYTDAEHAGTKQW